MPIEGADNRTKKPVVILSTADYRSKVWTNKQHIASRLAEQREVIYIESLGLREPTLNKEDVYRIIKRLFKIGNKSNESVGKRVERVKILSPVVIPYHRFSLIRKINQALINRFARKYLPSEFVLWTFSPVTYNLEILATHSVYHSVDLLHTLPLVPAKTLLQEEKKLVKRVDHVIASSKGVHDHLLSFGLKPLLWENVADVEMFRDAASVCPSRVRQAIFVGNLTPTKIKFSLLEGIVNKGVSLVLAGPVAIDGVESPRLLEKLLATGRVSYLGVLDQKEMAKRLAESWVGIIPYNVNKYTEGVFPMKVYEYLAAGLRVVSTPLSSLKEKNISGLYLEDDDEFVTCVSRLCSAAYEPVEGEYAENSWTYRIKQIENLVEQR